MGIAGSWRIVDPFFLYPSCPVPILCIVHSYLAVLGVSIIPPRLLYPSQCNLVSIAHCFEFEFLQAPVYPVFMLIIVLKCRILKISPLLRIPRYYDEVLVWLLCRRAVGVSTSSNNTAEHGTYRIQSHPCACVQVVRRFSRYVYCY